MHYCLGDFFTFSINFSSNCKQLSVMRIYCAIDPVSLIFHSMIVIGYQKIPLTSLIPLDHLNVGTGFPSTRHVRRAVSSEMYIMF